MEIVNLHKISYTYPNGSIGLKDVSFKILSGSKIALVGANGSGKTTLLLLLNALIKPNTGKLKMFGEELSYSRKALFQLRKKIGFVMQESDYQLFAPSVYEEISFGLSNVMADKTKIRKIVSQVLEQFNLNHLTDATPQALSTGQKKWLVLASILAINPDLIICDEPAASLDPAQSNELFCLLNKLNSDGKTILISTHDMDKAYEWADIVIVMNNGSVVAHGNADEVFYNGAFMQLSGNLCLPKVVDFCKKMNYPNFYPKNMNELLQKLNTEKKWV